MRGIFLRGIMACSGDVWTLASSVIRAQPELFFRGIMIFLRGHPGTRGDPSAAGAQSTARERGGEKTILQKTCRGQEMAQKLREEGAKGALSF